jgi:acyl carrier protein
LVILKKVLSNRHHKKEKLIAMEKTVVIDRLFSILENDFNLKPDAVDPDRPIFEQLPLDSMQLVAVAAKVEEVFNIELPLTFMEKPTLNHFVELVVEAGEKK